MFFNIERIKEISMKHIFVVCLLTVMTIFAANDCHADEESSRRTWNVDGTRRQALVYVPTTAKVQPAPIVFAFHGHGGNMERVSRMWDYQKLWSQAIVVYMQGLKTPGQLTDPEGNNAGWQHAVGDHTDRDLQFFDAVLASLEKEYPVDKKRIYATGHSNGGGFTYLLWEARPSVFAAFAPSAAVARSLVVNNTGFVPKPVFAIAGEDDSQVKFAWQQSMIRLLRKRNKCSDGKPSDIDKRITIYPSSIDSPVVTYNHSGGHIVPDDAPDLVVKFFKQHVKS